MKKKVDKMLYENSLGSLELVDIEVDLSKEDTKLFEAGYPIEELDYGLSGNDIEHAEFLLAQNFYHKKYLDILTGIYEMNSNEIRAIQDYLGLNMLQFSKILGLDRGSLANIYKRNTCSHPVQILIIERLKSELYDKGSARNLYDTLTTDIKIA